MKVSRNGITKARVLNKARRIRRPHGYKLVDALDRIPKVLDPRANIDPILKVGSKAMAVKMNPAQVEQIPLSLTRFNGLLNSVNSI